MKKDFFDKEFDERQIAERGRAFRNAYLTISLAMLGCFFVNDCLELHILDGTALLYIPIWLSATVFAVTAINRNAFITIQNTNAIIPVFFGITGIIMTVMNLIHLINGDPLVDENGYLGSAVIFVFNGICMIVIFAAFLKKGRLTSGKARKINNPQQI